MGSSAVPRLSIVLEWENVLSGGEPRAEAMLRQLNAQAQEICNQADPCIELISVFDPTAIDADHLHALVEERLESTGHIARTYVAAEGEDYYGMKNVGARRASAPLIMFLDSDVVPESNWLAPLINTCDSNPAAGVVASSVYLETGNLMQATLALIWVFHPRHIGEGVLSLREMRTNSTVFRREIAIAHPFKKVPGTARSSCALLTEELLEAGVSIVRSMGSRLEHPAPNGVSFFSRAIARGRDAVVAGKRHWAKKYSEEIRIKGMALIRQHRRVGISWWQLPAAAVISLVWWAFNIFGALATLIAPRYMKRHFLL